MRLIVFLGAPHKGLHTSALETLVESEPTEDMIRELKSESPTLTDLNHRFAHVGNDLDILTCYELSLTKTVIRVMTQMIESYLLAELDIQMSDGSWKREGKPEMMVSHDSARLWYPREKAVACNSDHSQLARLKRSENGIYPSVRGAIKQALASTVDLYNPQSENRTVYDAHGNETFADSRNLRHLYYESSVSLENRAASPVAGPSGFKTESEEPVLGVKRYNEQHSIATVDPGLSPMIDNIVGSPEHCAVTLQSSASTDAIVNKPSQAHGMFQRVDSAKKSMVYGPDLSTAISSGNVERTRELLAKSYDVNCKSNKDGSTPLHTAALNRHEPMIKLLVEENGANQGARDNDGNTALHLLSVNNGVPLTKGCIDLLFCYRPPFEANNRSKITPLMLACENGEKELADRLVQHGAPIDACDAGKKTALHYAAKNTKSLEVVTLLIREGAQVNRKAKPYGRRPLHQVASYCKDPIAAAIVEHLLNAGADREAKETMRSDTPLLHAVRHQNEACAAQLLKSTVNTEATDTDGYSALHIAVQEGNLSMVNLLLEYGVNPCAKTRSVGKMTPRNIWIKSNVHARVKEQIQAVLKEAELARQKRTTPS